MTLKQGVICIMVLSYLIVGCLEVRDHEWRLGIVAFLLAAVQALIYLWR